MVMRTKLLFLVYTTCESGTVSGDTLQLRAAKRELPLLLLRACLPIESDSTDIHDPRSLFLCREVFFDTFLCPIKLVFSFSDALLNFT